MDRPMSRGFSFRQVKPRLGRMQTRFGLVSAVALSSARTIPAVDAAERGAIIS
jgi:hypothetical protein